MQFRPVQSYYILCERSNIKCRYNHKCDKFYNYIDINKQKSLVTIYERIKTKLKIVTLLNYQYHYRVHKSK